MNKKVLHSILFGLLISGCSQEEILNNQPTYSSLPIVEAGFEQTENRTYIEDGKYLRWNQGDQISFFYKSTLNLQYEFDGDTGDNAGTFSPINQVVGTGNDLNRNYAVYPYASTAKISEEEIITTTLPSVQNYAENSFGLGANTMVAATQSTDDTFLKFKNVCGYLKLQLYGDDVTVKSITLIGNANEKLAGEVTITPVYDQAPAISMTNNATNSITLDCGEGVKIGSTAETATAFWIVVPPTTFESGFGVTITNIDGDKFIKSTPNKIEIERNVIKPMGAFKIEGTIPNNQIWYTSSDGKVITPRSDIEILSNIYDNGKGIITFEKDITKIGNYTFENCSTLTQVIIPNSVTSIGSKVFNHCTSLTVVHIPKSVNTMGDAFCYCSSLISVSIPESVTIIPSQLFYGCSSLPKINIPNNVTYIGKSAFYGCSSLSEITLPENVTEIGPWAFSYTGIKSFTIPNKIEIIEERMLYNCPSLTEVTIPKSVTSIGYATFFHCKSLKNIYIEATNPPTITRNIFNGDIFTSCTLHVPRNCGMTYYNSFGWAFEHISEDIK